MCGIIGTIGYPDAADALLQGLRRLEYRGYDSAGIALQKDAGARREAIGQIPREARLQGAPLPVPGLGAC